MLSEQLNLVQELPVDNNITSPNMNMNPIVQPAVKKGGSKTILWLIIALVIVVLIIGGGYWYLGQQQTTPESKQTSDQQANILDNLTTELNSEELPTVESEFTEVDTDLQNL